MPKGAIPIPRVRPLVQEIVKELDYEYCITTRLGGGITRLADLTGLSEGTISRLTTGKIQKNVSVETLDKILAATDREWLWHIEPKDGGFADWSRGEAVAPPRSSPTKEPSLCRCGQPRHPRSQRCRVCFQAEKKAARMSTKPKCECGKTISWGAKRCRLCHKIAVKPILNAGTEAGKNRKLGRSTTSLDSLGPKQIFAGRQGMSAKVTPYD